MKTFKKKSWALVLLAVVGLFSATKVPGALAAAPTLVDDSTNVQQYKIAWQDRSTINFTAVAENGSIVSLVNLNDNNWDSNWDYSGTIDGKCTIEVNGFGSSVIGVDGSSGNLWQQNDSIGRITVSRLVNGSCKTTVKNASIAIGRWQNAKISFRATATDEITSNDNSNSLVYNSPRLQSDGSIRFYRTDEAGDKCQDIISVYPGGAMKLFEQDSSKDNTSGVASPVTEGCYLEWISSNPPRHANDNDNATVSNQSMPLENASVLTKPSAVQDGNGGGGGAASGGSVQKGDSCTTGDDCKNGICQKDNGDCTAGSCQEGFVSFFAFFVCPSLDLIDGIIGAAYGQVENQLCFNTGKTSTTNGIICDTTDSLGDGVKTAWDIFKNIASALLVIVMLVMVLSQAIGGGPFDAYTVRKMLPKLVAAVIIMQLSYVLLRYAIDLSNDAGMAIGSLIMAPFGGPDNMGLGDMIGRAVATAAGSKGTVGGFISQTSFDVFATIATIGALYYAIPALPLLGLYVLIGVFVAFFTLVIRKLLIIMLVILAPLAFIAWLLPGTERYWKLWRENITKLLVMFPLVMAMLSAGRIFAYITSKAGNGASMFNPHLAVAHFGPLPVPYIGSATGFANLAIIIIAYFAPYFLLPKTFSWGGQLLGQVGRAVEQYSNKGAEPGKKFLKNREESYRAERQRRSQERVANNEEFKWNKPWQKPIDLLRSGKIDPTLGAPRISIRGREIYGGSRRRRQSIDSYVFKGIESEDNDLKNANARAQHTIDTLHFEDKDPYARLLAAGRKARIDNRTGRMVRDAAGNIVSDVASEIETRAGADQVVRLGGDNNISYLQTQLEIALASGDHEQIARANKILTAHVSTLFKKMPQLYKNPDYHNTHNVSGTVSGLNATDLTELSAPSLATLLRETRTGGDTASENRLISLYIQTVNDANRRGSLPPAINRELYTYASSLPAGDPRQTEILRHVKADGTLNPI